jgi:prophage tail gpP-like protein
VASYPESKLSVRLALLEREIDTSQLKEWELDSSYLTSTDGFSFTAFSQDPTELRDLELEPVEFLLNGASQGYGRIDISTVGDDGSAWRFEGRDNLADMVECEVDPTIKAVAGDTLGLAIARAMAPCGFDGILDADENPVTEIRLGKRRASVGKRKSKKNTKLEDYKPNDGEGIYEFCNRLAARHGVTIQPGPDRSSIAFDRPDYEQEPMFTLRRSSDPNVTGANNVIRATARRDFSKFPTYAFATGHQAKSGQTGTAVKFEFSAAALVESMGLQQQLAPIMRVAHRNRRKPTDPTLAPGNLYRLLYHRDKEARDEDQLINSLSRSVAERMRDTLVYTATVKSHFDLTTGAIWTVGAMVNVEDSIANVHEKLWVAGRKLNFSSTDGATTTVELWRPGSFVIHGEDL